MSSQFDIEKMNRSNFRASLEALSRPGTLQPITPFMDSGLLAMASILLYAEVSYWYDGDRDFQIVRAICGVREAERLKADYLFFDRPDAECLRQVNIGTPEIPESGATLIIGCRQLAREGIGVKLSGPGVRTCINTKLPVTREFITMVHEVNSSFPMGVDLFFVSDDHSILGLPRTTRIEVSQ